MSFPDQASTRIDEQALAEIVTIELVVTLLSTAIAAGERLAIEVDQCRDELPDVFDSLEGVLERLLRLRHAPKQSHLAANTAR